MNGGRSRRGAGVALLMIAVLGVAGLIACTGDDPGPGTTTTPTANPSTAPPPTPTATPPAAPKAEPTPKSAEAFVKYFWEVHNFAYSTLDTDLFTSTADEECAFCSSTAKDIEELRQSGTRIEGSQIKLFSVTAPPSKITTGIIVAIVIEQDPGKAIRADGSVRDVPRMKKTGGYVGLNWTGEKWLVDDVAIDKSGK